LIVGRFRRQDDADGWSISAPRQPLPCRARRERAAGGREAHDAEQILRAFATQAEEEIAGTRCNYHRDFGRTRLLVLDSRAGRVLDEDRREMLSEPEWAWVEDCVTGDFDQLLIATTLPLLLSHGLHHLEAWKGAVCDGAWVRTAARLARRSATRSTWSTGRRSTGPSFA
jgi:hypothetical protein